MGGLTGLGGRGLAPPGSGRTPGPAMGGRGTGGRNVGGRCTGGGRQPGGR